MRSLLVAPASGVALTALLISYLIEALQYVNLLEWLGWQHYRVASIVLGSHFEWIDMLAYTLGILAIMGIERLNRRCLFEASLSARMPPA